ncbi:DUF5946 family protein [Paenibacillus mendelii]|uniref:DUF5946 family protein n=1 Tax=Paenibacillus mendelii TaxID=206163 RepID=A0ABV6J5G5_9BACL|nr:DUF5946 family protein [Paenibacillus mendelii]MCQ6559265.1 DUF5946 family protein [Paenibacillus mendelii]
MIVAVDNNTVMEAGRCIECGAKEIDGLSCFDLFGFPLVWEHNDPELYALHFWLVSCYMIQHPSNYTVEGYKLLVQLFIEAYDNDWSISYILKKNREITANLSKITNPLPNKDRKRERRWWSMTIEDIYLGGERHAIDNITKWKEKLRGELDRDIN